MTPILLLNTYSIAICVKLERWTVTLYKGWYKFHVPEQKQYRGTEVKREPDLKFSNLLKKSSM
jgi:hypothetical protein